MSLQAVWSGAPAPQTPRRSGAARGAPRAPRPAAGTWVARPAPPFPAAGPRASGEALPGRILLFLLQPWGSRRAPATPGARGAPATLGLAVRSCNPRRSRRSCNPGLAARSCNPRRSRRSCNPGRSRRAPATPAPAAIRGPAAGPRRPPQAPASSAGPASGPRRRRRCPHLVTMRSIFETVRREPSSKIYERGLNGTSSPLEFQLEWLRFLGSG